MSKPKHTPGPWILQYDRGYYVDTVHDDQESSGTVCNVEMGEGCPKEMARANAALIAASPELLEALKAVVASYEAHTDGYARQVLRSHYEAAKAAIARAEAAGEGDR